MDTFSEGFSDGAIDSIGLVEDGICNGPAELSTTGVKV